MPPENLKIKRIGLLIAAYQAGLIELTEEDRKAISHVLKHPLKASGADHARKTGK
jgi:hypothetical protein